MVRVARRSDRRPGRQRNRRDVRAWLGALLVAALFVPLAGPGADAVHPSWETPHDGDGPALTGLDLRAGLGVAVGLNGRILTESANGWNEGPVLTDRHLAAVAFAAPGRGLAVGEDGTMLSYGPQWETPRAPTSGVVSADGTSGSGATERRIIEWRLPLSVIGIGTDSRFGLGVTAQGTDAVQTHPPDLDPERPITTGSVRFNDVMQGSPTTDGQQDAMWSAAVHAEYPTGDVPFSVHLLRSADALHVMVGGRASLVGATLQLHQDHGSELVTGDQRFLHPFAEAAAGQSRAGAPTWGMHRAPDSLTSADLRGVAWLDPVTPIVVGTGGAAFVRDDGLWSPLATGTTRDLNAVTVRDGTAIIVGASAPSGAMGTESTSGAVMLKSNGAVVESVPLPPGTYGLHAVDDSCTAGGSGGTVLVCLGGDLTQWDHRPLSSSVLVSDIDRDPASGLTWIVGSHADGTPALFQGDGGGWSERFLAMPSDPLTAIVAAGGRLVVAASDGDLHTLSKHAPKFDHLPTLPTAHQGEPFRMYISGDDIDDDILEVHLSPRPGMPFPEDHDLTLERPGNWSFDWTPPPTSPPKVAIDITLSDGDMTTNGSVDIIVIDENMPPYWDPHPDVTITHSLAWLTYVQAHDPDLDPLTLSAGLPAGATFSDLGGGLGRVDWTPTAAQLGVHTLTFVASDGALSASMSFEVTVVTNEAPDFEFVHPTGPLICVQGPWWSGTVLFSASAVDPEGTAVTYQWTFHDDGSTASGPSASHTYTQSGTHQVSVVATDAHGVQSTRSITVRVDECVHVTVEVDTGCITLFAENSGRVRMWDHTGAPTNGTFTVRVSWEPLHEALPSRSGLITGTITNGTGAFTIPVDHDRLILRHNEPGDHRVEGTGYRASLFGGQQWDRDKDLYRATILCQLPLP